MSEQDMMSNSQMQSMETPEVQSEKELELIQELVSLRKETNRSLEYETLDGYRMPPGTHFAMLKKPAVSIKYGKMTFNMAAIRMFEGTVHILPMLHEGKHRLAVVPCKEEETDSVEWARKTKCGKWANKDIRSEEFVRSIFDLMKWDPTCRYKVLGRIVNSERGLIFVFDLDICICYEKGKESYTDPVTGKTRMRQIMRHIDNFGGHVGRPYDDYEAARKLNQFEDIGEYDGRVSAGAAAYESNDYVPIGTVSSSAEIVTSGVPQVQQQTLPEQIVLNVNETVASDSDRISYQDYFDAAGNE